MFPLQIVKLKAFKKFKDNTDALAAATGFIEGIVTCLISQTFRGNS